MNEPGDMPIIDWYQPIETSLEPYNPRTDGLPYCDLIVMFATKL